ncbi:MAG TPA: hypothetical protein VE913_08460 [Longimicrobium sp.]|nr:hypothetical protein [Longimicrobium sp.]
MRPILPLLAAASLGACNSILPGNCTLEARQSVAVEVRDSITGSGAAAGARGTLRDGTYSDTLNAVSATYMSSAATWERPGSYEVTIDKPGYLRWTGRVRATRGECHVESEPARALLRRAP